MISPVAIESQPVKPEKASSAYPDDAAYVRKAQNEDLGAYDELIRRYQERVYATVYNMTSNHEDAR
ncbi:MAG: polymerase, sigma-24 subunit, subfamily, partial [Verrucomicrobiales bacterium]|nr:polymerase, sigma-24 subunit, subfamily [Verrucomicrobiales bacterium]